MMRQTRILSLLLIVCCIADVILSTPIPQIDFQSSSSSASSPSQHSQQTQQHQQQKQHGFIRQLSVQMNDEDVDNTMEEIPDKMQYPIEMDRRLGWWTSVMNFVCPKLGPLSKHCHSGDNDDGTSASGGNNQRSGGGVGGDDDNGGGGGDDVTDDDNDGGGGDDDNDGVEIDDESDDQTATDDDTNNSNNNSNDQSNWWVIRNGGSSSTTSSSGNDGSHTTAYIIGVAAASVGIASFIAKSSARSNHPLIGSVVKRRQAFEKAFKRRYESSSHVEMSSMSSLSPSTTNTNTANNNINGSGDASTNYVQVL